ncbi:hypothetical protein K5I29_00875 [Flavobacterium agricola]|uniref:DUF402 domain-containing protein n=1 Tax=Flavobacterium agricola TaxID=2870839 RepID=A0ABY6M297_9FLAO|nr:hypothetical protein [Flavobacterium agricola]UYW01525.1 hypothetical protein K5I29_00875 [Flavobacterium agricola]
MIRKKYTKENFFKHTYCIFDERDFAEIENVKHNYSSHSGSKYIFVTHGVYRISNHWGRVANCRWRLNTLDKKSQQVKLGFALWSSFYPNNEDQNIFFICFDAVNQTYTFKHFFEANPADKHIFRTAAQTAKVLKDIKEVLETKQWAKHLKHDNYEALKKQVLNDLITTNLSFIEIKRQYL